VLRAIGPEIAKHPLLDPAEEEKIIAFFGARRYTWHAASKR